MSNQADTERLDWLERQEWVEATRDDLGVTMEWGFIADPGCKESATLRQAIDFAMDDEGDLDALKAKAKKLRAELAAMTAERDRREEVRIKQALGIEEPKP